uniref:Uncharacterized protein n=1 Tax=Anopheles darlingi TaxID=43151 RepID=A0A2M4D1N1_ANODA
MSSVSGSFAVSAAVGIVATEAEATTAPVAPAFESSSLSSDPPLDEDDFVTVVDVALLLLLLLFSFGSVTIGSVAAGGPSESGSFSLSLADDVAPRPPLVACAPPPLESVELRRLAPLALVPFGPETGVGVPVVAVRIVLVPLASVAASLFDSTSSSTDPGRLSVVMLSAGLSERFRF